MAKIVNGEITSINEGIVADIEVLLKFASQNGLSDEGVTDAVMRVSDYLATYKLDENHGE